MDSVYSNDLALTPFSWSILVPAAIGFALLVAVFYFVKLIP
jgi:hypothetical protein